MNTDWKICSLSDGRRCGQKTLNDDVALLLLETDKADIRETIMKIKVENSNETNARNLNQVDVGKLKETAEFLGKDIKGMNKDGVIIMVIAGIFKRLKYKCGGCNKIVNSINNSNTQKCVSCDTDMCHECYTGSGRGLVCDPCQEWVASRMVVPLECYRKNFKKNDAKETENSLPVVTLSETMDESMPLGQNHPINSTTIENVVNRGASMFDDPTIIEPENGANENTIIQNDGETDDSDITKIVKPGRIPTKTNIGEKEKRVVKTKANDSKSTEVCKYFRKANCRHGFSGKKPVDGVNECPYTHPIVCRKFINNGRHNGGCRDKDCTNYHPKICSSSYKNRTCTSVEKCTEGFHLKGTKFVKNQVALQTDNVVSISPVTQNVVSQNTVPIQNAVTQNQGTVTVQPPVTQNVVTQSHNAQPLVTQNAETQNTVTQSTNQHQNVVTLSQNSNTVVMDSQSIKAFLGQVTSLMQTIQGWNIVTR